MRKIFMIAMLMAIAMFLIAPTPAKAADVENIPIIGIIVGAAEIPYSAVKNIISCSGVIDCVNVPKQIGKGVINGTERAIGTTVNLVAPKTYERAFSKNSKIANNKVLSNVVGWGGVGLGAASLGMASNGIFSINQSHNALLVTGVIVGTGTAAADVAISGRKIED